LYRFEEEHRVSRENEFEVFNVYQFFKRIEKKLHTIILSSEEIINLGILISIILVSY